MTPPIQAPVFGAIGWLDFDPQAGHEHAGRRPALVLSQSRYNQRIGLAIFCPITSRQKGYPFELLLPHGLPISGVVLCDQARSLDWRFRRWEPVCCLDAAIVEHAIAKLSTLFGDEK